ncbi:copper transporter [Nocardia blacklockiae]|uniref:copper transporter n=1 Tax=Nocardia blacklockiae TaxID=480036 RepID=UPI001894B6DB|nr:copper transporter [Nocardia blacklockiae]MBF6175865.1 copper transporter [Nocardia blacklockiae]
MFSIRRYAVPIAAILLALAVGVLLGAQSRGGPLRTDSAAARADELAAANDALNAQVRAADAFVARSAGRLLGGTLTDRTVLVFTTPDADGGDVEAVTKSLTTAGAVVSGTVALTDAFVDSGQGDRLRTAVTNMIPAGAQLPTGAVDQGSLAGDLLGVALLTDPANGQPRATDQERGLILDTLRGGGFLTADTVHPAQLAVVVTGDGARADENNRGSIAARFAGGLKGRGAGVVLAGRPGAAAGSGPIAVVREDARLGGAVSTVDNVDREIGRVTTALALGEQLGGVSGRYGTGDRAGSLTVTASPR